MPARIVVFGATGYTGRLTAERLVAQGERPLLAGRSRGAAGGAGRAARRARAARRRRRPPEHRRRAGRAGRRARSARSGRSSAGASRRSRAAIARRRRLPRLDRRAARSSGACSTSSAAPPRRAGATLLPAMGYDFVPGALAGALALEDAGERRGPRRRRLLRAGRRRRSRSAAARGPRSSASRSTRLRLPRRRACGTVRSGRAGPRRSRCAARTGRRSRSAAPSTSGCRRPIRGSREVNVYLGWFGPACARRRRPRSRGRRGR